MKYTCNPSHTAHKPVYKGGGPPVTRFAQHTHYSNSTWFPLKKPPSTPQSTRNQVAGRGAKKFNYHPDTLGRIMLCNMGHLNELIQPISTPEASLATHCES